MAQIHNEIGALADLKAKLRSKGIYEFDSLQNILDFLKEFPQKKNQIILEHYLLIYLIHDLLLTSMNHLYC